MSDFNLAPPEKDKMGFRNSKVAIIFCFGFIPALAIIFIFYTIQSLDFKKQFSRNQNFDSKIINLNREIDQMKGIAKKYKEIKSKLIEIDKIEENWMNLSKVFDAFVEAVPESVILKNLERKGEEIFVQGVSESKEGITHFMRNIEKSNFFKMPDLNQFESVIENDGQIKSFKFIILQNSISQ